MKTLVDLLTEYITETLESKFNKYVSELDDILDICTRIKQLGIEDVMQQYFDDLIRIAKYRPKELFIYASGEPYFKIPYAFYDSILELESEYPQLKVKPEGGNKLKIYYKDKEIFETGSGSIGRVSTEQQETATCIVWNSVVEGANANDISYGLEVYRYW